MKRIIKILMDRDGLTKEEATAAVKDCLRDLKWRLDNGEQCGDICEEHFGLEPDFFEDLLLAVM